jgi:hypothetical protein
MKGFSRCCLHPSLRSESVTGLLSRLYYDLRKDEPLSLLQEHISGPDSNVRMCPSSRNTSCYCNIIIAVFLLLLSFPEGFISDTFVDSYIKEMFKGGFKVTVLIAN